MTAPAMPSLRRAVADDATCLSALAIHVFLDTYATSGIDAPIAREAFATCAAAALVARITDAAAEVTIAEVMVVERGPQAIGFAEVLWSSERPAARDPEVRRLYVHPRFKRRGIGRALLARAEHDAQARDAAAIWLTAWAGNVDALAFYAALGWRDVGSTPHVIESASYENRILVKPLGR